jgi:hypothetical protein
MKILYKNLPFKTNRGFLGPNAGLHAPDTRRLSNVALRTLHLPSVVYHMSTTPIKEFTPNRIFYVSFSKEQAFFHLKQYIEQLQKKINDPGDTKIYLYTLKPRVRTIRAVVFDKTHRPKTVSNAIGLRYNTFKSGNAHPFREGSGDNMILGHLLCSKTGANGIRNSENQDELAICNPRNFFTVFDREVLDVGLRTKGPNYAFQLPSQIQFKNMKYVARGRVLNLLHKYGTSKIQETRAKLALKRLT